MLPQLLQMTCKTQVSYMWDNSVAFQYLICGGNVLNKEIFGDYLSNLIEIIYDKHDKLAEMTVLNLSSMYMETI